MEEAKKIQIMSILAEIWEREHGQQLEALTVSSADSTVIYRRGERNEEISRYGHEPDDLVAGFAAGA